ncbi:MAG: hypothetical protein CMK49_02140 [Prochlorococcus sp. SP3034]|nr:hypothetical protein [Prochlorococcus sp. SP3034]|tara:strand:- start:40 stop:399 length:360 start_codon:yes stop_codon:yes gene_type:complete
MKKNSIKYSDLTRKELEFLKDTYVEKKIESMSHKELKAFVFESINHQIKDTIGNEEEIEAWRDMEGFFGENFEELILQIQKKFTNYSNYQELEEEDHKKRSKLIETNKIEDEKKDMWED